MSTQLSGQFDLFSATEGSALPNTTEVANFFDPNLTDTASAFTATIDWGDGTATTTGTVTGANGSFTVDGGHTFMSEGFFNATVTIVRTADNSQLVLGAPVEVTGDDTLTGSSAATITGNPNVALTDVVVATFSDSNTITPANDFTTAIDWGDGTTTTGTLTGSNGSFTVTGSHTYAAAGGYTVTTFMNDIVPDTAVGVATTQAEIGFGGTETLNAATATVAIPANTTLANFADVASDPSADYTATIDWGDGSAVVTGNGTVSGSNGQYTVTSNSPHTYADFGDFTITVTVTNTADSAVAVMSGTVAVADGNVFSGAGVAINGNPNQALNNVEVATFTDQDTATLASQLFATVNWGDGTTSAGTVLGSGGTFSVDGSHTYAAGGSYTTTVTIGDDPPGTSTGVGSGTATINLAGQVVLNTATEDTALPGNTEVATFSDTSGGDTANSFTATINWGDGTTTTGTVGGSAGAFTVSGGHTYLDPGIDTTSVTLTRTSDQAQSTVSGPVVVIDGNVFTPQTLSTGTSGGQMTVQATFSDSDLVTLAGGLEASITWGDGSVTAGTVTGSNGMFAVSGAHTYTAAVSTILTVAILDDPPGTAAATNSIALQAIPVVTPSASNVNATPSENFAASALFSAGDVEAVPITYQVEDQSTGPTQGFWVLNGAVLPNGQITTLSAAQLSELSFVAGSSSAHVGVRHAQSGGLGRGRLRPLHAFTVNASANCAERRAPTVTAANVQKAPGLSVTASSLFSATAFRARPLSVMRLRTPRPTAAIGCSTASSNRRTNWWT